MSLFSPIEWAVLGSLAFVGVLACLRSLADEVARELTVHQLRVRAAHLKIAHLREMRAEDEPIGVDIIEDDEVVQGVEQGVAA